MIVPQNFENMLKEVVVLTDKLLGELLHAYQENDHRFYEAMCYAVLGGGKRLRAFLCYETSSLFDVDPLQAIWVGTAIECVHSYSLIHDDLPCMDDSDVRRGKPALHCAFDEATAVLVGDALLTLAFEILTDERVHSESNIRLNLIHALAVASGANGMVGGQIRDIMRINTDFSIETLSHLQNLKTGKLIHFSVKAGIMLANVEKDQQQYLLNYADNLGFAFQIIDDILDIEGDVNDMGKPVHNDVITQKTTFPSLLGVEPARRKAEDLIEQAITCLDIFGEKADSLRQVASFVIARQR